MTKVTYSLGQASRQDAGSDSVFPDLLNATHGDLVLPNGTSHPLSAIMILAMIKHKMHKDPSGSRSNSLPRKLRRMPLTFQQLLSSLNSRIFTALSSWSLPTIYPRRRSARLLKARISRRALQQLANANVSRQHKISPFKLQPAGGSSTHLPRAAASTQLFRSSILAPVTLTAIPRTSAAETTRARVGGLPTTDREDSMAGPLPTGICVKNALGRATRPVSAPMSLIQTLRASLRSTSRNAANFPPRSVLVNMLSGRTGVRMTRRAQPTPSDRPGKQH